MPTPQKTSSAGIIEAARDLIAEHGLDALTMHSIAERVGVRAPSLYKYYADRNAVLKAVELTVVADLEKAIAGASTSKMEDKEALRSIAAAFRRFAHEAPARYKLVFQLQSADADVARRRALQPALDRLKSLLGDAELAFVRARVLTSFLHGFVSMEAAGAFRMGGDVDEAFTSGIELLLKKAKK